MGLLLAVCGAAWTVAAWAAVGYLREIRDGISYFRDEIKTIRNDVEKLKRGVINEF